MTSDQIITDEAPADIVTAHKNGQIDRQTMLDRLAEYPYTWGTFYGYDGYIPGTFDELVVLALEGSITDEELQDIVEKLEN